MSGWQGGLLRQIGTRSGLLGASQWGLVKTREARTRRKPQVSHCDPTKAGIEGEGGHDGKASCFPPSQLIGPASTWPACLSDAGGPLFFPLLFSHTLFRAAAHVPLLFRSRSTVPQALPKAPTTTGKLCLFSFCRSNAFYTSTRRSNQLPRFTHSHPIARPTPNFFFGHYVQLQIEYHFRLV